MAKEVLLQMRSNEIPFPVSPELWAIAHTSYKDSQDATMKAGVWPYLLDYDEAVLHHSSVMDEIEGRDDRDKDFEQRSHEISMARVGLEGFRPELRRYIDLRGNMTNKVWLGALGMFAALGSIAGQQFMEVPGLSPVSGEPYFIDDPSIWPGDSPPEVFGIALPNLPGVDDIKGSVRIPVETNEVTVVPAVTIEETTAVSVTASSVDDFAENPFSPDFELTGQERKIAEDLAEKIFINLPDKIVTITVNGFASDEAAGEGAELGQSNPGNELLAASRAEVAVAAIQAEAAKRGVVLPEIEVTSEERVLEAGDIALIDQIAAENGMTTRELLNEYNLGTLGDFAGKEEIQHLIDENRGIEIILEGEDTTITTIPEVIIEEEAAQETRFERKIFTKHPGELVAILPFLAVTLYGTLFPGRFIANRAPRLMARYQIAREVRKFKKLNKHLNE